MLKITLPIYYTVERKTKKDKTFLVWMNRFRNAHFQESNKVKQDFHELIKKQIHWEKFEKIKPYYKLYIKNKKTDWWNVIALIEKFLLDWLVENWVIKNDTYDIVVWHWWADYYLDKENPRCEVFIKNI